MASYELLVKFPIQLFFVLTPIAAIAALIGTTPNCSSSERTKISIEASLIAFGILFVAAICGPLIFSVFKISNESFQIAGGVYLCLIGLDLLSDKTNDDISADEKHGKQNVAITPLAMPLLAGPGTISYIFLMRSKLTTNIELLQFFIGIFAAIAIVAGCFIAAARASNSISQSVTKLGAKITGLMIICIGAQVISSGIKCICS